MRIIVDLSWGSVAGVAGYKIRWGGGKEPGKAVSVAVGTRALQLSVSLKAKVLYTFSVSSYDKAGNESKPRILKAVYVE